MGNYALARVMRAGFSEDLISELRFENEAPAILGEEHSRQM